MSVKPTISERIAGAMHVSDIERFKDATKVGATVYVRVISDNPYNRKKVANSWIKTSIMSKAPHVAMTMKGTYRWIDLCIWQKEHKEKFGY